MDNIKNPIFIKNATDPITGKYIKEIYQIHESKLGSTIKTLIWNFYKNRNNTSIETVYKRLQKGNKLKIIFFKDSKFHDLIIS